MPRGPTCRPGAARRRCATCPAGSGRRVPRGAVDGRRGDRPRRARSAAENVIALAAALALGGLGARAGRRARLGAAGPRPRAPAARGALTATRTRIAPARTARATLNYLAAFVAYVAAAVLAQARRVRLAGSADRRRRGRVAWAAGLVVVIAPGGIGVRELVYVGLLAGSLPRGEAAAGAVTLRLVTIVAELPCCSPRDGPRCGRGYPHHLHTDGRTFCEYWSWAATASAAGPRRCTCRPAGTTSPSSTTSRAARPTRSWRSSR